MKERRFHFVFRSRFARHLALGLGLLLVLPVYAGQIISPGSGQGPQNPAHPGHPQLPQDSDSPFGDQDPVVQAKRQRMLNADRQKSMVSDTNKLLKLAAELNDEVKSTNSEALTSSQLRKLTDIEKLAHKVKENMSVAGQGAPSYVEPPFPMHH